MDNSSIFKKKKIGIVVAICDLVHDVEDMVYLP